MREDKKEEGCCSSKGCDHCCFTKLLIGMLIGAFIFASGMWYEKASCRMCHSGYKFCPFIPPAK
jgi:hypothetical protein